jgi:glycosyltransferase involved in cell wall biosynthesis
MKPILTIGMSTYEDYHGLFFSIQALRMFHDCNNELFEFVIIDNNPSSEHGKAVKNYVENWTNNLGKYIPYQNKTGTSSRNEIFKYASGEYVLVMDCHVLIEQNGIQNLLNYYMQNPDTNNLITGPILYDCLNRYSTHFKPEWREGMYGTWAEDYLGMLTGKPFEIPMQGLGLFSCKKDKWPGFNENFRGFGGEEGYIHEKFRQNGGKCICIPDLKWNHRFNRPDGIKYPNTYEDRIWNYFIGWMELYKDPNHPFISEIYNHFAQLIPETTVKQIFDNAVKFTFNP